MKKNLSFLICSLLFSIWCYAQPANDNCSTAQNLGTLPAPANCPSGVGNTVSVAGTITGATAANPYIYQNSCTGSGGPNMGVPANDVWYSFVASGYQAVITVNSTFTNPNVAFYAGNCSSLGGGVGGCAVGTAGTVTLTVEQMVIGTTYYIQVSGNTGQTGSFNISVRNNRDCQDCLTSSTLTANPPPVNGMYQPGQTVTFCYHVNNYSQINTNWLHGVQVTLGSGWNAGSILATTTPPACQGSGQWVWQTSCTSSATGQTFGQGWYFDTTDPGTNGGNNFGDNCSGNISAANWNFCFSATTNAACSPGSNLSVTINTSGDGESGSWSSLGCTDDPPSVFNAVGACCPPVMSSTATTCAGNNGTATATPVGVANPYTYSWSGPSGYSNVTTNVAGASTITGLLPGTYTVTITNAFNCAQTATVTVANGGTPPVVSASNTGPYCVGGTISLSSSGGATYSWSGPGAFTSLSQNPSITSATTTMSGVYTVTVTTVGGCTATATTSVTVNALPVPTANNGGPYCAGNTVALTSSGGTSYAWSGPGFSSTQQNPNITTATVAMSGVYTVTVTTGTCTATATTSVTVNPAPVPSAANTGPYCAGDVILLSSSGGGTYTWSGPSSFVSATQNPSIASSTTLMSGIYTVTVTVSGCTATATTSVTVNPIPVPVANNAGPFCEGTAISLSSGGGGTYLWDGPLSFSSSSQNPSIGSATTLMSGVYTVTVTASGCTATATTSVTVNPLPVPTAGNGGPYCPNATIALTSSGGGTYSWSGPNGFASTNQNPSITTATTAMDGVYSVTVTTLNCTATASTSVTVNSGLIPNASSNTPVCEGTALQFNCTNGISWTWSGPNGFSSALQNPSVSSPTTADGGIYSVTATDASGCSGTTTLTVVVNPMPVPTAANSGPYCEGTTISLSSSGGGTYLWDGPLTYSSSVQNPAINLSLPGMSGVYTVTVTLGPCSATATTSVTVNPLPVPSASDTGPYCEGAIISLSASGGGTYSWNGPAGFISTSQNPSITSSTTAMTGAYSVTVTALGCTATATTNVTVNPLPVPVAGSNSPVCENQTINLTANNGFVNYGWAGPNGFISTTQNPSVAPATLAASGTYTLAVIDANGCTASTTTSVTVNAVPLIAANNNGPLCPTSTLNLTSTGGLTSYSWTGPNSFSSFQQNPSVINVTSAEDGIYTLTVTDANGCSNSATTTVVINGTITVNAGSNSPVCENTAINLNAGGAANYSWTGPSGFSSAVQNPSLNNATPAMSGTYSVTGTDANGCSGSATVTIVVNPLPLPSAGNNGPLCAGTVLNLTSTGGGTYSWTGPNSFSSTSQNPSLSGSTIAASGIYTVTVTSAANCTATATTTVTVNPMPVPVSGSNSPVCNNGTINLTAGGGTTYAWSGPAGFASALQNPAITNANTTMNGVYTVTVTATGGCSLTSTVSVSVYPALTVTANQDITVCAGTAVNLSSIPSGGNGIYVFAWTPGNIPSANATVTPTVSTTYTISVTSCGQTATDNVIVTVNPLPAITITPDVTSGCAPLCVKFSSSSIPASADCDWTFSNGITVNNDCDTTICFPDAGQYGALLSVTDVNGCMNSLNAPNIITVFPVPDAAFTFAPDPTTIFNPLISFVDESTGANVTGWNWSFGDPLDNSSALQNPSFNYDAAGTYTVGLVVTSDNGCVDSTWNTVVIDPAFSLYVPNAFTPNDDGINDGFFAKGEGLDLDHWDLWIYDRWGNMIFYTDDFYQKWDGKVQGKSDNLVQMDVYVWKIRCRDFKGDKKFLVGHVTVVR
jgi:gliding motility-associated-like protein